MYTDTTLAILNKAKNLYSSGDLRGAEALLKVVIEIDQNSTDAWSLLKKVKKSTLSIEEFTYQYNKKNNSDQNVNVGGKQNTTAGKATEWPEGQSPTRKNNGDLNSPPSDKNTGKPSNTAPESEKRLFSNTNNLGSWLRFWGILGATGLGCGILFSLLLWFLQIPYNSSLHNPIDFPIPDQMSNSVFTISLNQPLNNWILSNNDQRLIVIDKEGLFSSWDVKQRKQLSSFKLKYPPDVFSTTIDGSKFIIADKLNDDLAEVKVWSVDTGELINKFTLNIRINNASNYVVWGVGFSPDGKYTVLGVGCSIFVYNILHEHISTTNDQCPLRYGRFSFSPGGRYLLVKKDSSSENGVFEFPGLTSVKGHGDAYTFDDKLSVYNPNTSDGEIEIFDPLIAVHQPLHIFTWNKTTNGECSSGNVFLPAGGTQLEMVCQLTSSTTNYMITSINWQTEKIEKQETVKLTKNCIFPNGPDYAVCGTRGINDIKIFYPGTGLNIGLPASATVANPPPVQLYTSLPSGDEQLTTSKWIDDYVSSDPFAYRKITLQTTTNQNGFAEVHITLENQVDGVWLENEADAKLRLLNSVWNLDNNSIIFHLTDNGLAVKKEHEASLQKELADQANQNASDASNDYVQHLGGFLVFTQDNMINVITPDGKTKILDPMGSIHPDSNQFYYAYKQIVIAPDGSGFYFLLESNSPTKELYFSNFDGTKVTFLLNFNGDVFSLSPDGKKIIIISQGYQRQYLISKDGKFFGLHVADTGGNVDDVIGAAFSYDSNTIYMVRNILNEFPLVRFNLSDIIYENRKSGSNDPAYYLDAPREKLLNMSNGLDNSGSEYAFIGIPSPNGRDILFLNSAMTLVDTENKVSTLVKLNYCRNLHWDKAGDSVYLLNNYSHVFYEYNIQTGAKQDMYNLPVPLAWNCWNEAYDWLPPN